MKKLKMMIKKWLGIDVIERKQFEMNKDIIACMEKDLAFEDQYPLRDNDSIRKDRPTALKDAR